MNVTFTNRLLDEIAPSHDVGWEWIRAMHEKGYGLRPADFAVAWEKPGRPHPEVVLPRMMHGAVAWFAGYAGELNTCPGFPDPVTAATWWLVERANAPAPVNPAGPTQHADELAKAAMAMASSPSQLVKTSLQAPWIADPNAPWNGGGGGWKS